ncbi:MAG: LuxR C-terminal-related transcriptional regulator, partial [Ilumatobacteraceae bacterium]
MPDAERGRALGLFRRCWGPTEREAELVDLLAAGVDTRAVAQQMFLSEHTGPGPPKSIFDKTGTYSRRELVTHATGDRIAVNVIPAIAAHTSRN